MTKKRVGIEISAHCIRMVAFAGDPQAPQLIDRQKRNITPQQDLSDVLQEMLGSRPGFADRFCAALPAAASFTRQLVFPFKDPRKINAAARMELSALLPSDISTQIVATTAAHGVENGYRITAATAAPATIAAAVQIYESAGIPLHTLGLAPFSHAGGLSRWLPGNVILVYAHEQELLLALIDNAQVTATQSCAIVSDQAPALAAQILRETAQLRRSSHLSERPLCLIGSHICPALLEILRQRQMEVVDLPLTWQGQALDAEFLPVAALALEGLKPGLNFRRDAFALKGEWTALKKHLIRGGILLLITLLISGATALYNYRSKAARAEHYRRQIVEVFKQTLPENKVIVDVPLQLQSALQQLTLTAQRIGVDKSTSALAVLREISTLTPRDLTIDIKTFNYEPNSLILDGVTSSFESVNRFSQQLEKSAIFSEVRTTDSKMSLDGQQINFRLQLTLSPKGDS